jgi:hypothetical protein
MTSEEVRDLGYLKWRDPFAWMEPMKGKRWEALLRRERAHFNELATQPAVEREARQMEKEIIDAQQYSKLAGFTIGCGTINVILIPNYRFVWKWAWKKATRPAVDIDVQGNIVWYITSDEDAHNQNKLVCESSDGKVIWTKKAVSFDIAVIGELCYYIKVTDLFRTVELCACNAQTGNNERVIYRETDKGRDLLLHKCSNRTLYISSSSTVNSRLYRINGTQIVQLAKNSLLQKPLGESIYGDDCILTRKTRLEQWVPHGKPISEWRLPNEEIEWINLQSGNIVTIHEGAQSIWFCAPNKPPRLVFKIKVGYIEPNIWTQWENSLVQTFAIKTPSEPPYMFHLINNKIVRDDRRMPINNPIKFKPLDVHRFHATSADGTKVPYIIIKERGVKLKAQLVYVYGAYGSSTPIGWPQNQWYPLLKRGWAMVYALVRGGGDIDAAWAEAARRENRIVSIQDLEAVIRASQSKNALGPEKTVVFGRSAGGVPVGAMVSRHPDGNLIGAAFAEVPYVDVLRTSSNPELPLTIGEFDEFGNPQERIMNFKALMDVSPVNTVPADGAPGVFVISRVGLLDRQVFAYESFKWIQRLRGKSSDEEKTGSKGKYVIFERNESHHYRVNRWPRFRAIDFAIFDNWVEGRLKM